MRATIAIDDDLFAEADEFAAHQRRTRSEIVTEALRAALATRRAESPFDLPLSFLGIPLVDIFAKKRWPRCWATTNGRGATMLICDVTVLPGAMRRGAPDQERWPTG